MLTLQELAARKICNDFSRVIKLHKIIIPPLIKQYLFDLHYENCGRLEYYIYNLIDGSTFCIDCGKAADVMGGRCFGTLGCYQKYATPDDKCDICAVPLYRWSKTKCFCTTPNAYKSCC